jgi:hypothetical protein
MVMIVLPSTSTGISIVRFSRSFLIPLSFSFLPCWIVSKSFDFLKMRGKMPNLQSRSKLQITYQHVQFLREDYQLRCTLAIVTSLSGTASDD